MMAGKLRIIFMGTPAFAAPALTMLCERGMTPAAVYTQPDRANKRGKRITFSPVKAVAMEREIPLFQPETLKGDEALRQLKALQPDIVVVIAYGRIIPKAMLSIPKYGFINVHASLLPKYRGAAPVQRAVIDGEKETGVTVMKIDEGLDTGDMILQKKVAIHDDTTAESLFDTLSRVGAEALMDVLNNLEEYLSKAVPQDESQATYAEKLTKEMGHIDWKKPARTLSALMRGMYPNPGTYTFFRGKRLKIHKVSLGEGTSKEMPGTIISTAGGVISVATGEGILNLLSVQPENKKQMTASDFINGHQVKVHDAFQ